MPIDLTPSRRDTTCIRLNEGETLFEVTSIHKASEQAAGLPSVYTLFRVTALAVKVLKHHQPERITILTTKHPFVGDKYKLTLERV